MSKWFNLHARVNAEKKRKTEVYVFDEIGGWGVSVNFLIQQIQEQNAEEIEVHLNSPGGDMFGGIAFYNYLRARAKNGATVRTINDGMAASAAGIIFLGGTERVMNTGSALMIHNPTWVCHGEADDFLKAAEDLGKFEDLLRDIYARETGMGEDKIREIMDVETWLTPSEALEMKFATAISDAPAVAANANTVKRFNFQHVPGALLSNQTPKSNTTMTDKIKQLLASLGVIKSTASDDDAIDQINAFVQQSKSTATALTETKETLTKATEQVATLTAKVDDVRKASITTRIEAMVKAGRLKEERKDALVATCMSTPDNGESILATIEESAPIASGGRAPLAAGQTNPPGESVHERFQAITDSAERSKFYSAHKDELLRA